MLNPALAVLHPLAAGLTMRGDSSAPRLGLGPDWAVRLASGHVSSVHADAVSRLRQAGWDSPVPTPTGATANGTAIAAALVPRCDRPLRVLRLVAIKKDLVVDGGGAPLDLMEEIQSHEHAEEMS